MPEFSVRWTALAYPLSLPVGRYPHQLTPRRKGMFSLCWWNIRLKQVDHGSQGARSCCSVKRRVLGFRYPAKCLFVGVDLAEKQDLHRWGNVRLRIGSTFNFMPMKPICTYPIICSFWRILVLPIDFSRSFEVNGMFMLTGTNKAASISDIICPQQKTPAQIGCAFLSTGHPTNGYGCRVAHIRQDCPGSYVFFYLSGHFVHLLTEVIGCLDLR